MTQHAKISYTRWLYATGMLEVLHDQTGSWTEVSRMVKGHGDSPGWAKQSMSHRHNVSERDIMVLEKLTAPPKSSKEHRAYGTRLTEDQKVEYVKHLRWLTEHGWTRKQLAQALQVTPAAINNALAPTPKSVGGSVERLTILQRIVDRMTHPTEVPEVVAVITDTEVAAPSGTLNVALQEAQLVSVMLVDALNKFKLMLPDFLVRGELQSVIEMAESIKGTLHGKRQEDEAGRAPE